MELRVGEMVIMLDYPDAKDWYVAEVSQLLHDRFVVNGFITREATMIGYRQASKKERCERSRKREHNTSGSISNNPLFENRSLFQEELSRADNPNRTHRCAHREIRLDR